MKALQVFLWVVALLLWTNAEGHGHDPDDCSKVVSRKVRRFLQKDIFSQLPNGLLPESLPMSCPLNPKRDLFHEFEINKEDLSSSEWKCNICNKRFVSEFYIDKHMSLKHSDRLAVANGTGTEPVCLADLCPIFGCRSQLVDAPEETYRDEMDADHYQHVVRRSAFQRLERCTPDKLRDLTTECQRIASTCFEGHTLRDLRETFVTKVCDSLRCARGVLEGGIRAETPPATRDVLYRVLRFMVVFIILLVACFQASLSEQGALSWLLRGSTDGRQDLVSKYARRHGRPGGLWARLRGWLRLPTSNAHKVK